MLPNTVASCSFGALQTKVLHPLRAATGTDRLAISLLFSCFATMLAPEFLFPFLPLLLQTSYNVNWATNMHVRSRRLLDCRCHSSRGNV